MHACVRVCVVLLWFIISHLVLGRCRHLEDSHSVELTGLRDLCATHEQARATMRERIKELEQNVAVLVAAKRDAEVCSPSANAQTFMSVLVSHIYVTYMFLHQAFVSCVQNSVLYAADKGLHGWNVLQLVVDWFCYVFAHNQFACKWILCKSILWHVLVSG